MSRGRFPQFNSAARSFLEADVGPVDDGPCGIGPCEHDPVYRVPWPRVGGDTASWGCHLARYREQHLDLFERVQEAVDEDLTVYATRGQRFLTFDAVPETLQEFVAIALLATGNALYEEDDPDATVTHVAGDHDLPRDVLLGLGERDRVVALVEGVRAEDCRLGTKSRLPDPEVCRRLRALDSGAIGRFVVDVRAPVVVVPTGWCFRLGPMPRSSPVRRGRGARAVL